MPPLIYLEESDDEEYLINPPSTEPTPDPGPPSKIHTKETTSERNYDALSEPSAPLREGSVGRLSPKDIIRYQKGLDPPRFPTLEERTKEAPWEDTFKSRILGQYKSVKAI